MSMLQRDELLTQSEILEKETSPPAKEAYHHSKTEPGESAYETRNPENIQDTCTGKFSAEESSVQFGHCAVDFGPDDFPRGLLPVRNGVDRGPDRQFGRAGGKAGTGGFD
jgi:hypothetical protein